MRRLSTIFLAAACLAGCAHRDPYRDILDMGGGEYMVNTSSSNFYSSAASLIAWSVQHAKDFCASRGEDARIGDASASGFPAGVTSRSAAVRFRCVAR